jgi:outer membrane protein assembly factor BamD
MNIRSIFSLILVLLLAGCSFLSGAKDTKKLVAEGFTPKELYEQAEDKVEAGSIDQAIDKYELILASYPDSKYAMQARLDIAFNLLKRKKYDRAIKELNQFIANYPFSSPVPYAYYLRGVSAEKKSSSILDDIVTDSAQRDVQSLKDAFEYFSVLIEKFPESKYSKDAKKRLVYLVNALARHELYVAIYYTRIGANIAAINRSKFVIEMYPNSQSIPDALHLIAFNYDLINADDLATDARKILSINFPNFTPSYSLSK